MSDDLISRLRDYNSDSPYLTELLERAADRIELLASLVAVAGICVPADEPAGVSVPLHDYLEAREADLKKQAEMLRK